MVAGMSRLMLVFLLACGGKPAAQTPSNVGSGDSEPKPVAITDRCAEQKTCTGCLAAAHPDTEKGSCYWDTKQAVCTSACADGVDCATIGHRDIGNERAGEACSRMGSSAP